MSTGMKFVIPRGWMVAALIVFVAGAVLFPVESRSLQDTQQDANQDAKQDVRVVSPPETRLRAIASPAAAGSAQASLATGPDGRVYLSWIEPAGEKRHALKYSVLGDSSWSAPLTIASGTNWFVNWADFPALAILPGGSMAAHWLERSGPDTYAYDVRIVRSSDSGATWSDPVTPHRDSTQTEHGFVSMFPAPDGSLGAVWLDGREMTEGEEGHGHGDMALRYAAFGDGGAAPVEVVLDDKVCECCQTSAALTSEGPVVVYRDRREGEHRDISVVRLAAGAWTAPRIVSPDGWKIDGCPVNGPAIAAMDRSVAVAWFTAARDSPKVNVAFSSDAGSTFGPPITVDDGSPSGRVDVVLLADGSAIVSWLERVGGAGELRARKISPGGERAPAMTIAPSGTARSSGFPRMVRSGNALVFAWIGAGVLTATVPAP